MLQLKKQKVRQNENTAETDLFMDASPMRTQTQVLQ